MAERQSVEEQPWALQRGSTMRLSTTAPEITLTVVKLAASMSSCRKASRHNKELAAKANIATTVSNKVFVVVGLEFPEGIVVTLISIFTCNSRNVYIYCSSSPRQILTGQLVLMHLARINVSLLAILVSLSHALSQLFLALASVGWLKRQRPPESGHAARGITDCPGDNKRRRVSLIKVPR